MNKIYEVTLTHTNEAVLLMEGTDEAEIETAVKEQFAHVPDLKVTKIVEATQEQTEYARQHLAPKKEVLN